MYEAVGRDNPLYDELKSPEDIVVMQVPAEKPKKRASGAREDRTASSSEKKFGVYALDLSR